MIIRTFATLLLALFAACAPTDETSADGAAADGAARAPSELPAGEPHIRGIVTAADTGSVRVEADPNLASGSPKLVARITPETSIYFRSGDPMDPSELTVGHNVSVWTVGPLMESYPEQGTAAAIVIEPSGIPLVPPP